MTMTIDDDIRYIKVKDAYELFITDCVTVRTGTLLHQAIAALIEKPTVQTIYVVDVQGKLVGIVPIRDLLRLAGARYGVRPKGVGSFFAYLKDVMKSNVEEFMRPPLKVGLEDNLKDSLRMMEAYGLSDLPVVDGSGKVLGELNGIEVLKYMMDGVAKGEQMYKELQEARAKKEREAQRGKAKK